MKSVMLRIRVEPEFKKMLENEVKSGKAKSISDLIRKALKFYITGYSIHISSEFSNRLLDIARQFLLDYNKITEELIEKNNVNNPLVAQLFKAEMLLWILATMMTAYAESCWKVYDILSEKKS